MSSTDYYTLLGVSNDSSPEEIKKAYRQAALQHHPDRNPDNKEAEEKFKLASHAYEILSDPDKRARYDRYGEAGLNGSSFNSAEDIFSSFGDVFEDFFGFGPSRRPRQQTRRGQDLSMEMELSFEEACFGVEKTVEITRQEHCHLCHGSGMEPGSSQTTCPHCRGSGQVGKSHGFFTIASPCDQCRGAGSIVSHPCTKCRGIGRESHRKKLVVKVPSGVESENQLVMHGEGEAGTSGGERGSLYILLHVRAHKHFERDGHIIYSEQPVSFVTATLGGEVEVETLHGPMTIKVPPGSQTGDTVVIEAAGVPHSKSKKIGDHVVRVLVKTPKNLNRRQEELLKEFAELSDETLLPPVKKKKGLFS